MKQRHLTIVAVASGLLCAAFVIVFMASLQGEANAARAEALARYGGEQVEVCVATRDIAAGERLDATSIESKLWVADLLPEDALFNVAETIGRTPTSSILKGEVLSEKRFDKEHEAIDVPLGMEAVSVPAKAVQAVGGAVRPGMRVDVYSSSANGTQLIVEDVLVLDTSVGESGSLVSSDSGWITLALEAQRVQEVVAAAYKTDISFAIPGESAQQDETLSADASETAAPSEQAATPDVPVDTTSKAAASVASHSAGSRVAEE